MKTFIGRERSAGLLELEQARETARPQRNAEIRDISDPVLDETAETADEPFLRARQRVPVRRRGGSKFARFGGQSRWTRIAAVLVAILVLGLIAGAAWETKSLLLRDSHFRLMSTQNIQVTGNRVVTNAQVLAFFHPDLGRSILQSPLAKRQSQIENIRWVRRATVMRLWPNRLQVHVLERTPIAFARDGNSIRLIDQDGVLLDLPNAAAQKYFFPILSGISGNEPQLIRAAQVELYREFVQALDAGGDHISSTLSEVDLSDSEDIRAIFAGGARQPLVHFGASDFLPRYQAYRVHLAEWLQQYPQLRSVDMRYGRQVVLDTGTAPPTQSAGNFMPPESAPSGNVSSPPENSGAKKPVVSSSAKQLHKSQIVARHSPKHKTVAAKKKKPVTTKHHAATHKSKHAPQRGHPVRNPIMHVVTGA